MRVGWCFSLWDARLQWCREYTGTQVSITTKLQHGEALDCRNETLRSWRAPDPSAFRYRWLDFMLSENKYIFYYYYKASYKILRISLLT